MLLLLLLILLLLLLSLLLLLLSIGIKAKKNQSHVAYDITNLQYHQNVAGEHQKYVDDMVRYRAQARTRNLVLLSDSRAPYNILNGQERYIPPAPREINKPNGPHSARENELMRDIDHRRLLSPEP